MKDEIKEINIKFPGQILDYVDTKEHLLELFNYITNLQTIEQQYSAILSENVELENKITNLQEENKKNKEYSEFYKDMSDKWKDLLDVFKKGYDDYKSRNEKAIEYMNNTFNITSIKEFYEHLDNIENILQGEDKDD